MVANGLIKEALSLMPYRNLNPLNTVGYKEIFDALDQAKPMESAIEAIKQNTRRFAKRQMTWFRRDQEIQWFGSAEAEPVLQYLQKKLSVS